MELRGLGGSKISFQAVLIHRTDSNGADCSSLSSKLIEILQFEIRILQFGAKVSLIKRSSGQ